jgi:hypothetical protein
LSSNLPKRENVRAEPEHLTKTAFCKKFTARKVGKLSIPTHPKATPRGEMSKVHACAPNFDRFGALGIFSQTLARHAKATLTPDRRIHAKQQGEADKDAINYDDEDPEPTDPSKQIPFVQFPRIRSGLWDAGRYSCNQ